MAILADAPAGRRGQNRVLERAAVGTVDRKFDSYAFEFNPGHWWSSLQPKRNARANPGEEEDRDNGIGAGNNRNHDPDLRRRQLPHQRHADRFDEIVERIEFEKEGILN